MSSILSILGNFKLHWMQLDGQHPFSILPPLPTRNKKILTMRSRSIFCCRGRKLTVVVSIAGSFDSRLESNVRLYSSGLFRVHGPLGRSGKTPYPPLLPMELMVAPLILRFRFHFEGKRPTNRLDKVRSAHPCSVFHIQDSVLC